MSQASLTDLQLAVMKALWRLRAATVSDIVPVLAEEGRVLAPTTVATVLQRLTKQGWVKQRKRERRLVYQPAVSQEQTAKQVLRRVVDTFFGGSVSAVTAQLLEAKPLSGEELERLRRLVGDGKG